MKTMWKAVLVTTLIAAIAAVVALKERSGNEQAPPPATEGVAASVVPPAEASQTLPRLVDLGADKCIPCKKMMPILAELKTEYADQFQVEFIDVWKNPAAGEPYGIKVIPTQIFYDASGQERFRHVGFFSKEDILAKWKELGVELAQER